MREKNKKVLDAIFSALKIANRPLSSREIVELLAASDEGVINGKTPWKTVNARLSEDIRTLKSNSRFKRAGHGLFALRQWSEMPEFHVKRRKIKKINEQILAIHIDDFVALKQTWNKSYSKIPIEELLNVAVSVLREFAEETDCFVQLIPTFVLFKQGKILIHKRTKRLPEKRLSGNIAVSFGGHMQADDIPSLFLTDKKIVESFILRELFEEISFSHKPNEVKYIRTLHLEGTLFERQHAGLVHFIFLDNYSVEESREPGMHINLKYVPVVELLDDIDTFDSWSQSILKMIIDEGLI